MATGHYFKYKYFIASAVMASFSATLHYCSDFFVALPNISYAIYVFAGGAGLLFAQGLLSSIRVKFFSGKISVLPRQIRSFVAEPSNHAEIKSLIPPPSLVSSAEFADEKQQRSRNNSVASFMAMDACSPDPLNQSGELNNVLDAEVEEENMGIPELLPTIEKDFERISPVTPSTAENQEIKNISINLQRVGSELLKGLQAVKQGWENRRPFQATDESGRRWRPKAPMPPSDAKKQLMDIFYLNKYLFAIEVLLMTKKFSTARVVSSISINLLDDNYIEYQASHGLERNLQCIFMNCRFFEGGDNPTQLFDDLMTDTYENLQLAQKNMRLLTQEISEKIKDNQYALKSSYAQCSQVMKSVASLEKSTEQSCDFLLLACVIVSTNEAAGVLQEINSDQDSASEPLMMLQ